MLVDVMQKAQGTLHAKNGSDCYADRILVGEDMIPALEQVAANDLATEVNAVIFLHFDLYFRRCMSSNEFKPPARSSRYHPFPPLLEPPPLHGVAVSG
jgi:hypothetical protein